MLEHVLTVRQFKKFVSHFVIHLYLHEAPGTRNGLLIEYLLSWSDKGLSEKTPSV